MGTFKQFLQTKAAKRAAWSILNSVMALIVAGVTYYATEGNATWAITVLPFAQAIAQFITKYFNSK